MLPEQPKRRTPVWRNALACLAGGLLLGCLVAELFLRVFADSLLPAEVHELAGLAGDATPRQAKAQGVGVRVIRGQPIIVADEPYVGRKLLPGMDVIITQPDYEYRVRTIPLGTTGIGVRREDPLTDHPFAVAVGDSFTFGHGVPVESCWVEQLRGLTGQDVVNLSMPNCGPQQYTRMLSKYGVQLNPRVAFWVVFPNDASDVLVFSQWRQSGVKQGMLTWAHQQEEKEKRHSQPPWLRRLAHHLMLARLSLLYMSRPTAPPAFHKVKTATLDFVFFDIKEAPPEAAEVRDKNSGAWELIEAALAGAQDTCVRHGITLIVVYCPDKSHTYWHLARRYRSRPGPVNLGWIEDRLRAYCRQHAVRFADLTPTFQNRGKAGEQLYFRLDGHWNAAGNALAAQVLDAYLREQGLLPRGNEPPHPVSDRHG